MVLSLPPFSSSLTPLVLVRVRAILTFTRPKFPIQDCRTQPDRRMLASQSRDQFAKSTAKSWRWRHVMSWHQPTTNRFHRNCLTNRSVIFTCDQYSTSHRLNSHFVTCITETPNVSDCSNQVSPCVGGTSPTEIHEPYPTFPSTLRSPWFTSPQNREKSSKNILSQRSSMDTVIAFQGTLTSANQMKVRISN